MQNLYLCNEKNESSSLNFTLLYICILEFPINAQKTEVSLVIKLHSVRDRRIVQTFLSDSYISTLYFSFFNHQHSSRSLSSQTRHILPAAVQFHPKTVENSPHCQPAPACAGESISMSTLMPRILA